MKNTYNRFIPACLILVIGILIFSSCSKNIDDGKGIGPVNKIDLGPINEELALKGRVIFTKKCMDCHSLDVKLKGPALRDVTKKRKAEWIMNMILNTEEMIKKDSTAKALFEQHIVKMEVKNVNEQDARSVLEYLRSIDNNIAIDSLKK